MALVKSFTPAKMHRYQTHDGIDATYYLHETDGRKILQINTSGRADRENPGKTSQSLQLDEESAVQLFSILKEHFGFK